MPGPLSASALDDEQRRLLAVLTSGPRAELLASESSPAGWALPGPFGPMLLAPGVGDPLQELGASLRYRGRLDDATRELAIVSTAAACGSRYELDHHLPLARAAGVREEILAAVVAGADPPPGSVAASAVVQACLALSRTGAVEPSLFSVLESELGRPGAFELVVLAGYYRLLATVLTIYGID